ncbi:MAG: winged helix-turn-helix domain-containing protein [Thermoanaerobaculia bacterium]|jgi:DNA-binding winged helix-turn-helix (wHTH) protein/tetratricopeptide (TPR) repeat protein
MSMTVGFEAYEFGSFRLDVTQRLLFRDGVPAAATPKVLDLLAVLVRNRGRVVMKEDLMREVWPDTIVDEGSLTRTVSRLRALLEEGSDPPLIETLSRRGYRFVGEVHELTEPKRSSRTLAVLPFALIGPADPAVEYLGIGIADALITRLSRLRTLRVRPTSAVVRFAGSKESVGTIGASLMVEAILEGHIQFRSDRIRVTVQLVKVDSEQPLWAETFDEPAVDWFDLQDSVSRRVTQALAIEVSADEARALEGRGTASRQAYQLYLKARYFTFRYTPESMQKSIELYGEAIATDPLFAAAHAGLGMASFIAAGTFVPAAEAVANATRHATRALELDDSLADAQLTVALLRFGEHDSAGAETSLQRCLDLAPHNALAHSVFSWQLTARQRFDEAIAEAECALALDPASVTIAVDRGLPLYYSRRAAEALEHFRRGVEMDPEFWYPHYHSGAALMLLDRIADAREEFDRAVAVSRGAIADALTWQAVAHARLGDPAAARELDAALSRGEVALSPYEHAAYRLAIGDSAAALELLDRAVAESDKWLMWIDVDPRFDSLRSNPRFKAVRAWRHVS